MKRMLTVCLVAMLALGLMGLGFAKWSDTVTIEASVATGNVSVGILDAGVNDEGPDPQYPPGLNSEGKDVAEIVSENGEAIGESGYYKNIIETISNGYPYYKPGTTFEIKNLGSIPVKIESITENWTGELADNIHVASWQVTNPDGSVLATSPAIPEDVNGAVLTTFADLVAAIGNFQLHDGEVLTVDIEWFLDQESEMLSNATNTITIIASQWNEVPSSNNSPGY